MCRASTVERVFHKKREELGHQAAEKQSRREKAVPNCKSHEDGPLTGWRRMLSLATFFAWL
jgi:hypothetical protein